MNDTDFLDISPLGMHWRDLDPFYFAPITMMRIQRATSIWAPPYPRQDD